tara:strand:+ start:958 stop:1176 length:219 start_codon:yes stop_codon:yes gene_type:complete
MVGIHYEELKIRQQEVEVRALAALLNCGDKNVREDAMLKLCNFAFPEMLTDKINNYDANKDKKLFEYMEDDE